MVKTIKPKYSVYVNKYRPKQYGSADFFIGKANTITEAKQMIKKNTRNGDSYCIAKAGTDAYRGVNQVRKGQVFGSGKKKICKDGFTVHF